MSARARALGAFVGAGLALMGALGLDQGAEKLAARRSAIEARDRDLDRVAALVEAGALDAAVGHLEGLAEAATSQRERARIESAQVALQIGNLEELRRGVDGLRAQLVEQLSGALTARAEGRRGDLALLGFGLLLALVAGLLGDAARPRRDESAMEALLKERLEALYAARVRAHEADRFAAYGELAAGLQHGLKTPLASVRAAAQTARLKIGDHPARAQLDDIIAEVDDLVAQIRTLLQAAGDGGGEVFALDPRELLAPLEAVYRVKAEGRGLRLSVEVESSPPLVADATLLGLALRNLIENALDAAPSGTAVVLRLGPAERPARVGLDREPATGDAWVAFSVEDEGPGLDAAPVPGRTTKPAGSGLGLGLARRIAERHGGTLAIERRSPRGTAVRIVLPVAESDRMPPAR